jgi:malto-oligosyltrehalose trehalohydrolase
MTNGSSTENSYAWGPHLTSGGGTRFRLWAPGQPSVVLRIDGGDVPMTPHDDGWFDAEIGSRPFGAEYGFVLADGTIVPDPASRRQADVMGLSTLIDPASFRWTDGAWRGRPWQEAVVYELHIGTFTREGTFRAAMERLSYLADIGFTAVEIMPVAHFHGERGWGYDGVYQYAPFSPYGTTDDFKAFVDAAHGLGLMVFLDVVYNHFGPLGNFLSTYAPGFFHTDQHTPWGPKIAFENGPVRRFFIENILYWLGEFHLDGLRLDAIDQIEDPSDIHILEALSREARAFTGERIIHLVTENPANGTDLLAPRDDGRLFEADWNDEFHHALHVAVTGETQGYYAPLAERPWHKTAQALAQGYLTDGRRVLAIEQPDTASLPPLCFVHFLQNHDQVGNRAWGDRLHMGVDRGLYRALTEMLLLSPQIPMLFMGEEHLSDTPFRFFADYEGQLRADIWANREKEARNYGGVPEGFKLDDITDPCDPRVFEGCKLDWAGLEQPDIRQWRDMLKRLLAIRAAQIVPLAGTIASGGTLLEAPEACVFVDWQHAGGVLKMRANFSDRPVRLDEAAAKCIYPETPQGEAGWLDSRSVHVYRA